MHILAGHLDISFGSTALDVKCELGVCFIVKPHSVLHHNEVQIWEMLCLDGKNSVYPRKKRLIVSAFDVGHIILKNVEHQFFLGLYQCLDQEPIVVGKEEELATCPSSLP